MSRFKPISISLSPNVEKDDVFLALNLLIRPWFWKKGKAITHLQEELKQLLGVKYAIAFNSGRSSFYAILKALNLEKGTNVLLQAFTCNAVPNPILWAELNPIYVDCNEKDFNIDLEDLKRKISPQNKVLVLQHTFGLPANMDEVMKIAKENDLLLIEDCAHALGAEFLPAGRQGNGQKVGTFGKASFFSFSRDKVISSVYGGMAVTDDDELGKRLQELQKEFGMPSRGWIVQQILHPVLLSSIILPLYNFIDLGKVFLIVSQWLHILSKAVSWKEKRGLRPDYFPKALPNALAIMALHQLGKLDRFQSHRKELAQYYYDQLKDTSFEMPDMSEGQSFLRFVIKRPKAHEIIYQSWHKENMLLGDWYTTPIAPDDTKIEEMKYEKGSCQNTEYLSKVTLNLPTHINITREDAERIVNFLKQWK